MPGEHSREILLDWGFRDEEVSGLLRCGAVI